MTAPRAALKFFNTIGRAQPLTSGVRYDAAEPDNHCNRNDSIAASCQMPAPGQLAMVMVVDTGPSIWCMTKDRCRA